MRYDVMSAHIHVEYWTRLRWLDTRLSYTVNDMFGPAGKDTDYVPLQLFDGDNPKLWIPDVSCWEAVDSALNNGLKFSGTVETSWKFTLRRSIIVPGGLIIVR